MLQFLLFQFGGSFLCACSSHSEMHILFHTSCKCEVSFHMVLMVLHLYRNLAVHYILHLLIVKDWKLSTVCWSHG